MEHNSVQVSIIMPVFNAERHLREAVESVRAQTFPHWELLMIDDGSTDQSGDLCDEYAQLDGRIRVFHTENGGVSRARNLGIENAAGSYIAFLDSDDSLRENFLQTFLDRSGGVALVVCSTQIVPEGTCRILVEHETCYPSFQDTLNDIERFLPTAFYPDVWNKLYLREKMTMRFDPKLSIGEDLCFNLEYMQRCRGIRVLPDVLNRYRVSSENSLTKRFRPNLIADARASFYARMQFLGVCPAARASVCRGLIERVMDQSILLAESERYSLPGKKAILDGWADDELWSKELLDLSAARNQRQKLFLELLKRKRTGTALFVCELFAAVLKWKRRNGTA